MEGMGFIPVGRHFEHPETSIFVEFPPSPLSVGSEPVAKIDVHILDTGTLRVISPTDSVKDRLSAYYHWKDQQALTQAILIARHHDIDLNEIRRWSSSEGKLQAFESIVVKLTLSKA